MFGEQEASSVILLCEKQKAAVALFGEWYINDDVVMRLANSGGIVF